MPSPAARGRETRSLIRRAVLETAAFSSREKQNVHFSRSQKKGQDKGPENELFGKTVQMKLTHLNKIWKTFVVPKQLTSGGNLHINIVFLPTAIMFHMIHTNTF